MQLYWLIFLLGALLPTASSLKLYNATEWKPTGSFVAATGTTYNVYKPVCPGRYRIGDVVISSDTNVDISTIAKALVCVGGESSEIVEATVYGGQKLAGTAALVREFKPTGGGNITNVLGAVSLPLATWTTLPQKGSTTETDDLRGYGTIVSPGCKLANCSGISAVYSDPENGYVFFQLYNALSTMNLSNFGYFLPLFRYAGEPGSDYLNPKCLAPRCFCETTCVHGVCNPNTGGCVCEAGWKGSGCSEDIDECDTSIAQCDSVGTCINTAPGYYCTCPGGYTLNSNGYTCDDINECLNATICPSGELCTNYQGGYECNNCGEGKVLVNGVCTDVKVVYSCGNGVLDSGEECDRGLGCNLNCTCSPGFTPKNNTDCSRDCGNGVLNAGEECDSGMGCLDTCLCDTNQGYQPANSTSCQAVYIETDPCARFNGNCSDCLAFNCLYCNSTNTCATNRISSDCLDQCPGFIDSIIVPPMTESSSPTGSSVDANAAMIQTVVPAVVISVGAAVAGVVVLVVLLKRREKKKAKTQTMRMSLQRSNSRRMTRNQSKYGIERNTINSSPDKFWEPPADSEFEEVDKMPFDMSKKIDFNVGSNQFKVGQQYTDVITITAKDKKSATAAGVPFTFHPPTTKKLKMEFNPSSGIVKKGKPVEVEVTMTMQMTTEIDVDIGVECSSEKKHSFITLHLMSELSSFIDLDEVVLEGGSGAKPVGDGAFGVVYKGKYRAQDVAVKMLKMQDMPEEMLDEFDREVDLMNKLRHKNIVQFIGASKVVGRFALVTEFIDKGNVANVIMNANKTLSYAFKIRVALDAARAMFFLHENKILHRDLKLDNLLCVSTNPDDPVVAKLTDFGTSRAVSEKISNSYTVGVGTPMYMSPEILAKKPYDTKSDVFSYGVMLWILYCQKEPYKNIEHSWEIARFVMEGSREKIPKDCPVEFKELIEQCWAQEPNQRPEFEQIVTRLEQMLQENEEAPVSPRSPRSLSSSMKLKKSLK